MLHKLIIGRNEEAKLIQVEKLLSELRLKINDPDVLVFERDEKIGIPETKQVRDFLSIKPIGENKAVIFWAVENISTLAQNALLKTIEDLASNGLVLLVGESKEAVLATLMSRVELLTLSEGGDLKLDDLEVVSNWMNASIDERFKIIEKIDDKEKFFDELAILVRNRLREDQKWIMFGKKVLQAEGFRKANGNQRAILEWLALELDARWLDG